MPKTVIMQLGQAKNPTGAMRSGVSLDGETLAGESSPHAAAGKLSAAAAASVIGGIFPGHTASRK